MCLNVNIFSFGLWFYDISLLSLFGSIFDHNTCLLMRLLFVIISNSWCMKWFLDCPAQSMQWREMMDGALALFPQAWSLCSHLCPWLLFLFFSHPWNLYISWLCRLLLVIMLVYMLLVSYLYSPRNLYIFMWTSVGHSASNHISFLCTTNVCFLNLKIILYL